MIQIIRKILTVMLIGLVFESCTKPGSISFGDSWSERTLKKLTLRERIAQMMIYGMNMEFLNENSYKWQEIKQLIQSDGVGGIHLWRGEAGVSMTMMNEIQQLSKIPILFDADIEKGVFQRFPEGTPLPPLMAIAATGNPQYAYEAGKIIALEGRALGIHWNFAPVVDVNINPDNPIINTRSFGEDPEMVGKYAIEFIRGLQEHGMLATAKHFPGHGDTQTDSHSSLASIPSDSSRLWGIELKPFISTIEAGVDAVMIGHVHAPDFQPHAGTPASLSPFWATEVLRNKLGFKGAIVTDAMGMGGITRNYTDTFALIQAINAGCDIIIQNYSFKESVDIVEEAVSRGLINEARINEAALRMLSLKEKVGLHRQRLIDQANVRHTLGSTAFRDLVDEMGTKAITLVKNDLNLIPLNLNEIDTLHIIDLYGHEFNHSRTLITKRLDRMGIPVKSFQVDESDGANFLQSVVDAIPSNGLVLINAISTPRAGKDWIFLTKSQTTFIHQINRKTQRLILLSFGNPYLIRDFKNISTYLCAYSGQNIMQNAAINALLGRADISGLLPVSIPGVAPAGDGLFIPKDQIEFKPSSAELGTIVKTAMPYELGADISVVKELLYEAIQDSAWPGGVLLAAKNGKIFIHEAFGYHTYATEEPTHRGDIFDLASITKVIATTSAVIKLIEQRKLNLDEKVVTYFPQFRGPTLNDTQKKATITIKQLITHTSGLPPFRQYYKVEGDIQTRLDSIFNTELEHNPGERTVYSDIGLIILGKVIEAVSGKPLDLFVHEEIFTTLNMYSTYFNPPASRLKRIVPTEYSADEKGFVRGHVHDENAHSIGGVAGHAGLFSTARDLAVFAQMMLNDGIYDDVRIFNPETVKLFTTRAHVIEGSSRCLGWDSPAGMASGGIYLSSNSFGHTGFTGTSLWIDPDNQMFVILLTNAVHPDRGWKSPKYFDWRQRIHSAVYEAVGFSEPNQSLELRERWR